MPPCFFRDHLALPLLRGSGMLVELFLLVLIIILVVLAIRSGKSPVLENPLIIHIPERYHITLAPQLDLAQIFIEQIAGLYAQSVQPHGDLHSMYFEVHDPGLHAQGEKFYLLAAAYRGRLLYFQAINPQPLLRDSDSHLKQIREFSEAVLALHPLKQPADPGEAEKLRSTVELAARRLNISVRKLMETQ